MNTMEWDAVKSYFTNGVRRLVDHQVDSFEDFIRNKLPLIIQSTAPITVWHEQDPVIKKYKYEFQLSFEKVTYMKPRIQEATGRVKPMLPMEARVRNFTYSAQMYADVRFTARTYKGANLETYDEESRVFEGISLGKLPVMLGSSLCLLKDYPMSLKEYGECSHDPMGYFIIHGSERTILCQEKVADNRIMVFQSKKTSSKHSYSVEMKSLHESFTMPPKKLEIRLSSKFNGFGYPLLACVPRFREDIPVMVFFRALGVTADADIANLVWGSLDDPHVDLLAASFRDCAELGVFTQEEAVAYLSNLLQYGTTQEDKCAYVRQLLGSEYLPHVRFAGENVTLNVHNARKCMLTASMIRRLLLTGQGQIHLDDRDAYPNKRVVTTGALLTHLFRQLFQKVCNDTRNEFVQEVNNDSWKKGESPRPMEILNINNLYKILKLSTIEGKLKQALATGNFTVQGLGTSNSTSLSNATKVGVSQVLARMSYTSTLSHLRRIQTPVEKSGKLLAPRKLHGTSWGFVCPVETPEGHSVGIVKNMSLMTCVSQHVPTNTVLHFLQDCDGITWLDTPKVYTGTAITLNGVIVGYTNNAKELTDKLRNAKYTFRLHPHLSVAWYTLMNTIIIETDAGRLVRPVFRVGASFPEKGADWTTWLKTCIEYIDASETETLRIALRKEDVTPDHTHHEIHPSLIIGHMASSIPLSDHNQSPRNTYQSAMGKQAMCIYADNYAKRLDKNGYILCSLNRPIVETRPMNILKQHEMPYGMNAIVAIACYGGYNQEDSIIMNKSSVNRGFMRGLYYTMYKDEEHRNVTSGREEKFMRPSKHNTRKYKNTSYAAISENGIPILNATIQENDVLIGKVVNLRNDQGGYAYRDASTTHKNSEPARIDGVWQDKNSDGYPFIKVRCVSERVPQIGDKFCLTDDHDVMTKNRGWVSIADVTTNDWVAQLNRVTGKMEYVQPLEHFEFNHEGEMYEVETQGVSLKTTLNHRMWVQRRGHDSYELITADKMRGKRVRFQSAASIATLDTSYDVGSFHFEGSAMHDWLTFVGIWFAEGWVYIDEKEYIRRVEFAANKPRVLYQLRDICERLDFAYSFNEKTSKFYVNERELAYHMQPWSVGATKKQLPECVWGLSAEQSKSILLGLCSGDGHESDTSLSYSTSSIQLRDDIQRVIQQAGWTSEYTKNCSCGTETRMNDGRILRTTADSWRIGIRRTRLRPTLNHGHVNTQCGQTERITLFDGKVYCISVPSEVFLVRRNGVCVFTGNSSRHGQKGTVGMLLEEEDMPFTSSGLRPDLIMNPHAVPSRMTIAQLMENIFGKIGVRRGTLGDGTPYNHLKVEELKKHMLDLGLQSYGNEILYNGQTGEMMEAEIFMGPTFYQRLKHMVIDKKHCLTDDHDVLTTNGWKPINEVTIEDKVATLQNGQVIYENPIRTYEYDNDGEELYEVESQQVSLRTTLNHRMWVAKSYGRAQEWRYGFHLAKDILGKHVKYQKDGDWEVDDYQFVLPAYEDEPSCEVDMDAWLTFFGIWYGDGWCGEKRMQVQIAANKPRVQEALHSCLPKLGFDYTLYTSSMKLHIHSKQLAAYMCELSVGATNKQLPNWVWNLSREQCQKLIDGLMLSDGHLQQSGSFVYSTSSDKLADDIQRLALHAGWSANKRLHTPAGTPYEIGDHSGVTTQHLWSMRIIKSKNRPAMNHGHQKEQNGQSEKLVRYDGKVYCLEVPGGVFYVRRKGLPVWTGNSRARGPIVSLTRQPCEGRARDGGLRVGEMERDCMLCHGAAAFTKERLMDVSDPFETGLCKTCGTLAIVNEEEGIYSCGTCGNKTEFVKKTLPYAMKLWVQELEAMHIVPRVELG
jgi:DNA-directed RNA polymerase II subunit RPB2